MERRRVDRLAGHRGAQAAEQGDVAGGIEGIRRALACVAAEAGQLRVGEVEPVHRHAYSPGAQGPQKPSGQGRFTRAGEAGDPEEAATSLSEKGIEPVACVWIDHKADRSTAPGVPSMKSIRRRRHVGKGIFLLNQSVQLLTPKGYFCTMSYR
jgi:hypothetical protein